MSMNSLSERPSTLPASLAARGWRLTLPQFAGLIVLFAALSAGATLAHAGWEKSNDTAWTGPHAGVAMKGFLAGATFKATVTKTNPYPDVLPVWNSLNHNVVAHHLQLFGWLVVLGELFIPLGVIALLSLRFAGSRLALIGVATLAVSLNLLYLHEGSAGDNAPMLLLWLTVLLTAVVFPAAAQAHAIDLGRLVRRESTSRPSAAPAPRERWFAATALLIVLVLESLLLFNALGLLLLLGATVALALTFSGINRALATVASRPWSFQRKPSLSGPRLDAE